MSPNYDLIVSCLTRTSGRLTASQEAAKRLSDAFHMRLTLAKVAGDDPALIMQSKLHVARVVAEALSVLIGSRVTPVDFAESRAMSFDLFAIFLHYLETDNKELAMVFKEYFYRNRPSHTSRQPLHRKLFDVVREGWFEWVKVFRALPQSHPALVIALMPRHVPSKLSFRSRFLISFWTMIDKVKSFVRRQRYMRFIKHSGK